MLLQAFYSIRSERQLMERLEYDLLFRWFVGIGVGRSIMDRTTPFGEKTILVIGITQGTAMRCQLMSVSLSWVDSVFSQGVRPCPVARRDRRSTV